MLSGSDSRSFSAWRLFAALGIVAVISAGVYADGLSTAPTAATKVVKLGSVSNIAVTPTLAIDQAAGYVKSGSQDGTRQASDHACPESDCASGTLTQSDDTVTDSANQVACGTAGVGTTANAWARCFDLAAEGFAGAVTINSVTFGVQQATIDDINIVVSLYVDPDGCPAGPFANAVFITSASTVVGTADEGTMITVCFPGVEVAAGSALVVDVAATADGTVDPTHSFRTMSNDVGQCGPSYLRAADCNGGVDEWQDLASIGFPDAHMVLVIDATTSICGSGPVCGDGSCDCGEACDDCVADCGVCAVCGNDVREDGEECDGIDDDACPGECLADCTCTVFGACCNPGGKIGGCDENQTQEECEGQAGGGTWLGDGSDCLDCVCENAEEDCLQAHPEPGCSDSACCMTVCDIDPFCCDAEWDLNCVDIAVINCEDTCGNGLCGPEETCSSCPEDCGTCDGCPASNCCGGFMSQSTDTEIGVGGIACATQPNTTANAWARCFMPEEQGWTLSGDGSVNLIIESVDFGFETSPVDGPLPVFANVYIDISGCPASGFPAELVGTAETELVPGGEGVLLNAAFDTPLNIELPAGAGLVVEFEYLLDGTLDPPGPIGNFGVWPGSNSSGQCGPTMIRSIDCGLGDWQDLAGIGFPNSHTIILVNGIVTDPDAECTFCAICGDGDCSGGEECFDPETGEGCQLDCGVCPFCGDDTCDADETCELCQADCGDCADCGYDCDTDMTQSTSDVDAANQVACGNADGTTGNAWARCFDLSENGLTDDVQINSVTFGIQQATIADIQVDVNLYLDFDGCPASGFGTGNIHPVATESILVGPGDEGTLITVNFPGQPVVPAGSSLIVEVAAEADGTEEPFHLFRSRANDSGQCRSNYLRSIGGCSVDWEDMATIGDPPFVDTHLVMSVDMSCVSNACTDVDCDDGDPCTVDGCHVVDDQSINGWLEGVTLQPGQSFHFHIEEITWFNFWEWMWITAITEVHLEVHITLIINGEEVTLLWEELVLLIAETWKSHEHIEIVTIEGVWLWVTNIGETAATFDVHLQWMFEGSPSGLPGDCLSIPLECPDGESCTNGECGAGCGSCPTDIDGNGDTGPLDLATLLGSWGPLADPSCLDADGNGEIGPLDLATLLGSWGPCS